MLHDGECPLCQMEVRHYERAADPTRLQLVDVHCREGAEILARHGITQSQALRRLHVITPDDRVVSGARAFVAVWEALPGWGLVARIASIPPVLALLEAGYRVFVPIRQPLSRWLARRLEAGTP